MHIPNSISPLKINIFKADNESLRDKAFRIRKEVFVAEQKVSSEEEFDQFEEVAHHFVALDENGDPVGAARWRPTEKGIKLERFAVKRSHRGKKVGSAILELVLKDIAETKGKDQYLYLHAQITAIPLYQKFGFHKVGEQFEECNILHYKMELFT